MRKLPNLNAVRAFDAAARQGSFASAATELGVTHAAVSRHVRILEAELGVELFERHARHITLTGEGTLFAQTAAEAFSGLELETGRLKRSGNTGTVVLDVESDLATRWLLPLMTGDAIDALNLTLDIRVRPDPPTSSLGDVDLAITWGSMSYRGYESSPFLSAHAFPVAAPALLKDGPPVDDPLFFTSHRLIHQRGTYWWGRYFDALGLDFERATGHLFLNRTRLCIDLAVQGAGLVIGDEILVRDHLDTGALVRLPGPLLPSREQYYLHSSDVGTLSPRVRALREWLLELTRTATQAE